METLITQSTNSPTFTIQNINDTRCDSIVQLNLIVNNAPVVTTTTDDFSISAVNISDEYLWLDCNNDFAPISNSNTQTLTPATSGSYAVQIEESGCIGVSDCVEFMLVGVKEPTKSSFLIHPNPTTQEINITCDDELKCEALMLYDSFGKLIKKYNDPNKRIDVSNIPPGLYFLTLKFLDGQTASSKILKL